MEKSFLLNSPKIVSIEVVKRGKVSRARLFYLRGKTGKAAKVKELIGSRAAKK
ncbi:50S ribosomal protein L19 [Chlamydia trachomatis]|nr:50S ribosomal protein L19 [Chlamydia trachomatis]